MGYVEGADPAGCFASQGQCEQSHPSSSGCWEYNGALCEYVDGADPEGCFSSSFACEAEHPRRLSGADGCWQYSDAIPICMYVEGADPAGCFASEEQCEQVHPAPSGVWEYNGTICEYVEGADPVDGFQSLTACEAGNSRFLFESLACFMCPLLADVQVLRQPRVNVPVHRAIVSLVVQTGLSLMPASAI